MKKKNKLRFAVLLGVLGFCIEVVLGSLWEKSLVTPLAKILAGISLGIGAIFIVGAFIALYVLKRTLAVDSQRVNVSTIKTTAATIEITSLTSTYSPNTSPVSPPAFSLPAAAISVPAATAPLSSDTNDTNNDLPPQPCTPPPGLELEDHNDLFFKHRTLPLAGNNSRPLTAHRVTRKRSLTINFPISPRSLSSTPHKTESAHPFFSSSPSDFVSLPLASLGQAADGDHFNGETAPGDGKKESTISFS